MLRFPRRPHRALLAGLTLLAGSAVAQTPPLPTVPTPIAPAAPLPTVPPPAVVPPPAPSAMAKTLPISPQARALFDQAIAAHKALSAVSATISVSTVGFGPTGSQTVTLAYRKPSEAKIVVADSAGPLFQSLFNGKTLTVYSVRDKKYNTSPVPPGTDVVISKLLIHPPSVLAQMIGRPEVLSKLFVMPGVRISLGAPDTVEGVPTDTVNASSPGGTLQFAFAFGTADHLLRRFSQTMTFLHDGKMQTMTHTETITALSAAPAFTAADFVFTPPPGATKIKPAAQTPKPHKLLSRKGAGR